MPNKFFLSFSLPYFLLVERYIQMMYLCVAFVILFLMFQFLLCKEFSFFFFTQKHNMKHIHPSKKHALFANFSVMIRPYHFTMNTTGMRFFSLHFFLCVDGLIRITSVHLRFALGKELLNSIH